MICLVNIGKLKRFTYPKELSDDGVLLIEMDNDSASFLVELDKFLSFQKKPTREEIEYIIHKIRDLIRSR